MNVSYCPRLSCCCFPQGTADAVRQYSWLLDDTKNRAIEDVLILSGDHL